VNLDELIANAMRSKANQPETRGRKPKEQPSKGRVVPEKSGGLRSTRSSRSNTDLGEMPILRSNSISNRTVGFSVDEEVEVERIGEDGNVEIGVSVIRRYESIDLTHTSEPSKKSVRLACSTRKMLPANRVYKGLPGDSRSQVVSAIRMIAAAETGCIAYDNDPITKQPMIDTNPNSLAAQILSRLKANPVSTTARGSGNVVGGYQIVR
jgi:hypothetical protein